MKKGIDVSRWQGNIDWSKVKSQIDFAIIKCGGSDAGIYKDSKFERNYSEAKKYNIPIGTYWFTKAANATAARTDAENFTKYLSGKSFELPVFLDIENTASASKADTIITTFLDTLKNKGFNVGLYTYYSYWKQYISDSVLNKYNVWLADYRNGKNYSKQFAIHQYSSTGRILGINGNVDMNYLYKESLIKAATKDNTNATKNTDTIKNKTVKSEAIYCVYANNKWQPTVKQIEDYAGVENIPVQGLALKVSSGKIKYRVHETNGKWLSWIEKYDISDWKTGVAGNKKDIDAIQIDYTGTGKVKYRVSYLNRKSYLPWIEGFNLTDENGYAGVFGKTIDKIQVEII